MSQRLTLASILLGALLVALDQTVVSTVIPIILGELGGTASYAWLITAYLVASTVVLPVAGRLAETTSPFRIYLASMAIFLLGSTLCGLARSTEWLILSRAFQGLGGGGMAAVGGTLLAILYPPEQRGKVYGYFGAVGGMATLLGPVLGGVLTDAFGWRAVFFINLVPGLAALVLIGRGLATASPVSGARFDWAGAVTLFLWSIPLLFLVSWGGSRYPWLSAPILGLAAGVLVGLALFVLAERRNAEPMLDLSLLGHPLFLLACAVGFLVMGLLAGSVLFLPLYLIQVRELSAAQAGLCMFPATVGSMLGSLVGGRMMARPERSRLVLATGGMLTLLVMLAGSTGLEVATPLPAILAGLGILGFGLGMAIPVLPLAAQTAAGPERLGTATSVTQFFQGLGGSLVAALMGTIMAAALHRELPRQMTPDLARVVGPITAFADEKELMQRMDQAVRARDRSAQQVQALEKQVDETVDRTLTAALRDVLAISTALALISLVLMLLMPRLE